MLTSTLYDRLPYRILIRKHRCLKQFLIFKRQPDFDGDMQKLNIKDRYLDGFVKKR